MGRRQIPAPGNDAVRAAIDAARLRLGHIGEWLRPASATKVPVSAGTLKNYRDGRREMPVAMRKLLAKQLRRHADRLRAVAKKLENSLK